MQCRNRDSLTAATVRRLQYRNDPCCVARQRCGLSLPLPQQLVLLFAGTYFLFVLILCFVSLAITIFIVHIHTRGNAVPPAPLSPTVCNTLGEVTSQQSVVTIRSPFCGYSMSWCVKLKGVDLPFYSNGIKSLGKKTSLIYQQNVFKWYHSNKHFSYYIIPTTWRQKISRHRYGAKLRHCHSMHIVWCVFTILH